MAPIATNTFPSLNGIATSDNTVTPSDTSSQSDQGVISGTEMNGHINDSLNGTATNGNGVHMNGDGIPANGFLQAANDSSLSVNEYVHLYGIKLPLADIIQTAHWWTSPDRYRRHGDETARWMP